MTDPMTTSPLDLPALKEVASAVEMFDDEWAALGTGPAGGDHWYICNDGESIASVSCQDGINEAEREPIARHIAAFDPPTVLALLDRLEAAERDLAAATVSRDGWQTRAEAAEKKVAAVRELHTKEKHGVRWHCGECLQDDNTGSWEYVEWPCPTITALDTHTPETETP